MVPLLVSCQNASDDLAQPSDKTRPEVTFVPTPQNIVNKMLDWSKPTKDDYIVDLGCGDGRIVIEAAKKYGCRGCGYDIDPKLIAICHARAKAEGVENLVEFFEKDIFATELPKDVTIVTMFLTPEMNLRLLPYLQSLPDGVRVVSHHWPMPGVTPEKSDTINNNNKNWPISDVFYFRTPMLVEANWKPEERTPTKLEFDEIKSVVKYTNGKTPSSESENAKLENSETKNQDAKNSNPPKTKND